MTRIRKHLLKGSSACYSWTQSCCFFSSSKHFFLIPITVIMKYKKLRIWWYWTSRFLKKKILLKKESHDPMKHSFIDCWSTKYLYPSLQIFRKTFELYIFMKKIYIKDFFASTRSKNIWNHDYKKYHKCVTEEKYIFSLPFIILLWYHHIYHRLEAMGGVSLQILKIYVLRKRSVGTHTS